MDRSTGREAAPRRTGAGVIAAALLAAWSIGAAPASPGGADRAGFRSRARFLMGTRLEVTLPASTPDDAFEAAFAEVARLERILSNWDATSELSRLNRTAAGRAVRCSPELFDAVEAALGWAASTDGAFDPTVEPLVERAGLRGLEGRLDPGLASAVAPAEPGDGTRSPRDVGPPTVGWRHVRAHRADRSIRFDAAGVGIDLGGIGKGFALDAAARELRRRGVEAALLDFGGQVLALGGPSGATWPIGVAVPGDREAAALWLPIRDASVSTSGNDERGRPDGAGHILDPSTGAAARFGGTVTVVAAAATAADALSTALFVMGPERGTAWADRHGRAVLYQWNEEGGGPGRRASASFPAAVDGGAGADGRP